MVLFQKMMKENDMGVITRSEAEEVIKIVRCKDCKHWHKGEWYNTCDKHIGHGFEDDYFCKYGERANNTRTDE